MHRKPPTPRSSSFHGAPDGAGPAQHAAMPQAPAAKSANAANVAFGSAALAAACIALLSMIGAWATPGYSHVSQFISELGASGALHEMPIRFAGFLPAGLCLLLYCIAAYRSLPPTRSTSAGLVGIAIYAIGYVVAAFAPCDLGCRPPRPSLSQEIHNAIGLLGYVAAPCFLFTLAGNARAWPRAGLLVVWGYTAAGVALAGLLTLAPESPFVGASQRAIEAAVLSWLLASGLYMRAQARHSRHSHHPVSSKPG